MKRISADEFAAHVAEYLRSDEPLEVEQDGRVIGQYAPTALSNGHAMNGHGRNGMTVDELRREGGSHRTVDALEAVLEEIYTRTGMTEDEFAAYFDLTRPFPYDSPSKA